jgi:pyrroloquinoline quinone biosynthesis protein D
MTVPVVPSALPRLAPHVRLSYDPTRQRHVLQRPESVVVLAGSAADILRLCDGRHSVAQIVASLGARYSTVAEDQVREFLGRLVQRRCVELGDG